MLRHAIKSLAPAQGAMPHGLPEHEWIHTGLDPHRKGLSQGGLEDIARTVMHQLRNGARTDWPDIIRLVSNSIEHVFILLVDCFIAPNPDRQPPRPGSLRPATDRGIEHVRAHCGKHIMDAAHQRRRVGAQIEVHFAWAYPMQQAVLTECDRFYLRGARQ